MLTTFFDKSKPLQFLIVTIYFFSIQGLFLYLNKVEFEVWEVFLSDIVFLLTISVFWTILYKQKFLGYKSSFLSFLLFFSINPKIVLDYQSFLSFGFLIILRLFLCLLKPFTIKVSTYLMSCTLSFFTPEYSLFYFLYL